MKGWNLGSFLYKNIDERKVHLRINLHMQDLFYPKYSLDLELLFWKLM
jgi:hypothetical protein